MCVWPIYIYLSVNLSVNSSVIQAMNHSSATIPFGQSGRIKSTWDLDCSNPKKDRNIYICVCVGFSFSTFGLATTDPITFFRYYLGRMGSAFWFPQLWPQEGHSWYALRGRVPEPLVEWDHFGIGFDEFLEAGPKGDVNVGDGPKHPWIL